MLSDSRSSISYCEMKQKTLTKTTNRPRKGCYPLNLINEGFLEPVQ